MAETGVATERPEPPPSATPHGHPIPLLWLGFALVAVLVAAGVVVWQHKASQWRADVTAGYAAPLRCTGTTVHETGGVPMVALRPDLRCTVRFRIANNGSHTVHLDTLTLPLMGPHTGAQLRAYGPHEDASADGLDALYHLDRDLAAHASFVVAYQLRFWPGGCIGQGISETISELPRLSLSALGTSGSRNGQARIGERGTMVSQQARGCPK